MGDFTFNEMGNIKNLLYSALTQERLVDNSTDVDIKFNPSTVKNEDDLYIKVEPLISEEIDLKAEVTTDGMELQCKEIKCEAADVQVKEENDIYIKLEPLISEEVSVKEEIIPEFPVLHKQNDNFIKLESCIREELLFKEEIQTVVIDDSSDDDLALFDVRKAEDENAYMLLSQFSNKASRSNELQPHPQPSLHHCQLCSYTNKRPSKVLAHMMIHTGIKPYSCEECSYKTAWKASLQDHFRNKHSGVKHLSCPECDFKTGLRQNLRSHIQTHNKDKPFKCSLCPFETRTDKVYRRHFKSMHDQGKPFKCDACDFETGLKRDLLNHMKTHTGDNYLKCNECEYRTLLKSCLRTHVKSHWTYKPFTCDKCDYKTALKGSLANHLLMHEKPFKCKDCPYGTGSKYFLKQHLKERGHTSVDETFKCEQCDFTSSLRRIVQWHAKIHSGKKLYECDECEYKTDCSSNLKKHKDLHDKRRATAAAR